MSSLPLGLMGLGAGCTFTPMAAEVMRDVPARLSGAASGVNNALRQVGSVLAAAVVGAVLQARLASSLRDQAHRRAAELPSYLRGSFVHGFEGRHLEAGGPSARPPAGLACLALRSVRERRPTRTAFRSLMTNSSSSTADRTGETPDGR